MGPRTVRLRILRFHNCEGCVRKVGVALDQIHGVEPVEFDPVTGNISVTTDKHPEVIKDAIERKTKKTVVILSEEVINPRNQNPRHQNPNSSLPPQSIINVQDLAKTLLMVSQAEGLNNIELVGDLNSNSFRLNFNQRLPDFSSGVYMGDDDYGIFPLPPQQTTGERSVPPRVVPGPGTTDQVPVYGYPPEFYGLCTTCSHDHPSKCCTIL